MDKILKSISRLSESREKEENEKIEEQCVFFSFVLIILFGLYELIK